MQKHRTGGRKAEGGTWLASAPDSRGTVYMQRTGTAIKIIDALAAYGWMAKSAKIWHGNRIKGYGMIQARKEIYGETPKVQ